MCQQQNMHATMFQNHKLSCYNIYIARMMSLQCYNFAIIYLNTPLLCTRGSCIAWRWNTLTPTNMWMSMSYSLGFSSTLSGMIIPIGLERVIFASVTLDKNGWLILNCCRCSMLSTLLNCLFLTANFITSMSSPSSLFSHHLIVLETDFASILLVRIHVFRMLNIPLF